MNGQGRFEPRHNEVTRHLASGIFNSGVVQIVQVLCQIGSVVVLSRLLPPTDFGLLAMAGPACAFISLFQDMGLSQATIQKPEITHDEVSAFFWINVAAGAALAAASVAISPLLGWYYGDPRVVSLTAAMGPLILFSAIGGQPAAILRRRMEFGISAAIGVLGAVTGLAVSIVAALTIKNYWALFFGSAAGTLISVAGVWLAAGWLPSRPRRIAGLGRMLKFGAGVTVSNLSAYFSMNTDNMLIGRRWGGQTLGLYDRAYKLLLFPINRISWPVMTTIVPVLSRLAGNPEPYNRVFLRTIALLTLATWPGIVWAIVLRDTLVPTLLGSRWSSAVAIFAPLAFAALVQTVNNATGYLYTSQGRGGELARISVIGATIDVVSFVVGLPYGATGVATAYMTSEFLRTPFLWWYVTRKGPVRATSVIVTVLPQLAGAAGAGVISTLYREFAAASLVPVVQLALGLLLSYGAVLLIMGISRNGRQTLGHAYEAAKHLLHHLTSKAPRQAPAE